MTKKERKKKYGNRNRKTKGGKEETIGMVKVPYTHGSELSKRYKKVNEKYPDLFARFECKESC